MGMFGDWSKRGEGVGFGDEDSFLGGCGGGVRPGGGPGWNASFDRGVCP